MTPGDSAAGAVLDAVTAAPDGGGADAALPEDLAVPDAFEPVDGTGSPDSEPPDAAPLDSEAPDSEAPDAAPDAPDAGPVAWRSTLYPEDWTPAFTSPEGAFLHDFSYAGYRNGEPVPDTFGGAVVDVVAEHGADPTGAEDATASFQAAIQAVTVAGGGVVEVPAGLFRIDGLLEVRASSVVIRGAGPDATRLWFPRDHDMGGAANLRFVGAAPVAHEEPLVANGASRSAWVEVADATGFAPGDDVEIGWTITDAFVEEHGMLAFWGPFNGQWQTVFRRQVVAVDTATAPQRVQVDVPLRYPALVRDGAAVRSVSGLLREVGIRDLAIASAVSWEAAWASNRAHVIEMDNVADAFVRNVHTFHPPSAPLVGPGSEDHLQSGGILVMRSKRVTVADTVLEEAQNRGGGGNGYLFEVMASSEVLFRDCVGRAGRHNFIQNWGFGTTGTVWLRCWSSEGVAELSKELPLGLVGASEYHHSLATANLVDDCRIDDGWRAENRRAWSSGAGHTATECVFWRPRGTGEVVSKQFGTGHVIGSFPETVVDASLDGDGGWGTAPPDRVEGLGLGETLSPASLYEDQRLRRLMP